MGLSPSSLRRVIAISVGIGLTAGAYLLSSGLHRLWWPAWIAPLPVLLLSPRLPVWQAFIAAVAARSLGALSLWNFSYLHLSRRHLQAVSSPIEAISVSGLDAGNRWSKIDQAMSRPTLEVADIIATRDFGFGLRQV